MYSKSRERNSRRPGGQGQDGRQACPPALQQPSSSQGLSQGAADLLGGMGQAGIKGPRTGDRPQDGGSPVLHCDGLEWSLTITLSFSVHDWKMRCHRTDLLGHHEDWQHDPYAGAGQEVPGKYRCCDDTLQLTPWRDCPVPDAPSLGQVHSPPPWYDSSLSSQTSS
jgi:hypothetical protein